MGVAYSCVHGIPLSQKLLHDFRSPVLAGWQFDHHPRFGVIAKESGCVLPCGKCLAGGFGGHIEDRVSNQAVVPKPLNVDDILGRDDHHRSWSRFVLVRRAAIRPAEYVGVNVADVPELAIGSYRVRPVRREQGQVPRTTVAVPVDERVSVTMVQYMRGHAHLPVVGILHCVWHLVQKSKGVMPCVSRIVALSRALVDVDRKAGDRARDQEHASPPGIECQDTSAVNANAGGNWLRTYAEVRGSQRHSGRSRIPLGSQAISEVPLDFQWPP